MFEATIRYNNFNDSEILKTVPECYDSLLIPGKMVSHSTKSLPTRIRNLVDDYGTSYYIDPTLPDFRIGNNFREDGQIKNWHVKYIDEIGAGLGDLLEQNGNVDASKITAEQREDIVRSAVRFQEQAIPNRIADNASKYEDIENLSNYEPAAVIPWYHKIRSDDDVRINDHVLNVATDEANLPLKPCIFVTQEYVQQLSGRQKILDILAENNIEQCFIWIEDLDKRETGQQVYKQIIEFVKSLSSAGIDSHFFYADYFATMISHFGLKGATYGSMYAEEAGEKETGTSGGGSMSRYYVEPIKDFMKIPAAVEIQQNADAPMCNCRVCSRQFESWSDLIERKESDENIQAPIKKHHLIMRWNQIQEVENQSLDETISNCKEDFDDYIEPYNYSRQISPTKEPDYMPRWINAIRDSS